MKEILKSKERENHYPHLWVSIVGVPASGKTSLGLKMSEDYGFDFFSEIPVSEIKHFEDYNGNPKEFSLVVQKEFLEKSIEQITGDEKRNKLGILSILSRSPVISEPLLEQNMLYALLRLKDNLGENQEYLNFFANQISNIPTKPDLVFYLKISDELLRKRIRDRAKKDPTRRSELDNSTSYWSDLNKMFDNWVSERKKEKDWLIVDINIDRFSRCGYKDKESSKEGIAEEMAVQLHYYGVTRRFLNGKVLPEKIKNYQPKKHLSESLPFNNRTD